MRKLVLLGTMVVSMIAMGETATIKGLKPKDNTNIELAVNGEATSWKSFNAITGTATLKEPMNIQEFTLNGEQITGEMVYLVKLNSNTVHLLNGMAFEVGEKIGRRTYQVSKDMYDFLNNGMVKGFEKSNGNIVWSTDINSKAYFQAN